MLDLLLVSQNAQAQQAKNPWAMLMHDLEYTGRSSSAGMEGTILAWTFTRFERGFLLPTIRSLPEGRAASLGKQGKPKNQAAEIQHYLNHRFSVTLLAGVSKLKVVPEFGAEDLSPQLPRIGMNVKVLRVGMRMYLLESVPVAWELSVGTSKGTLHFDYADARKIIDSSDDPWKYHSGDPLHIREVVDASNTTFGGSVALSMRLYFRRTKPSVFLLPKAWLLNFKLGADVMLLRADNNEIPFIGYSQTLENGFMTSALGGEIVSVGDWVLFYVGLGMDYMIGRNLIIKVDSMIGRYPVSGPVGELPDTWGSNRTVLIGLELLF